MKIPKIDITDGFLRVREYNRKDAESLSHLITENRSELNHTFPLTVKRTATASEAADYIGDKIREREQGVNAFCGIFLNDGTLIGQFNFTKFDWNVPKCEAGYFINKALNGKGFATAATRLCMHWAFNEIGIEKITLRIWPQNHASIAVARKLGAREVGLAHNDFRSADGKLYDSMIFELLK
ncbi:MAG: GNAT family N-acetyltransferase [Bacteroidia bacterium]|nr:GNAT family N-acetyltransferase [Bacteroidia bacterium]